MEKIRHKKYCYEIQNRSAFRYLCGLIVRWKQHIKYEWIVKIARKNGAYVGEGVIMPISLARKANANLHIGNHVSIQTANIDLRSPVYIGNNVIIGAGTEILTTSHNIDSPLFDVKHYGIVIEDYSWIPTKVLILPSCRKIGYGSVVSSGSVVVKDVLPMKVVGGNPAVIFKDRKNIHTDLVVEMLLGGDYSYYKKYRNNDYK